MGYVHISGQGVRMMIEGKTIERIEEVIEGVGEVTVGVGEVIEGIEKEVRKELVLMVG